MEPASEWRCYGCRYCNLLLKLGDVTSPLHCAQLTVQPLQRKEEEEEE